MNEWQRECVCALRKYVKVNLYVATTTIQQLEEQQKNAIMTFKLLLQPLPLLKQMLKHKRAHNNCVVGYAITKGVFLYRRVSGRQFETKRPTYNSLRRQTPWLVAAKLLL